MRLWEGKNKGGKIKCPRRKKHETIKMAKKNSEDRKEGMSCIGDRRGKRDKERERGWNRGQSGMRCGTMIDGFLAGSICHAVIGRKMEYRSGVEGQRERTGV